MRGLIAAPIVSMTGACADNSLWWRDFAPQKKTSPLQGWSFC
jgi:hypothetical protein